MESIEVWRKMITYFISNPQDFLTVPKINRENIGSLLIDMGGINNVRNHSPSCQLSVSRRITYTDFDVVYSHYD